MFKFAEKNESLSNRQVEIFNKWLEDHAGKEFDVQCPCCKTSNWERGDGIYAQNLLENPSSCLPILNIFCSKCGYIMAFAARMIFG